MGIVILGQDAHARSNTVWFEVLRTQESTQLFLPVNKSQIEHAKAGLRQCAPDLSDRIHLVPARSILGETSTVWHGIRDRIHDFQPDLIHVVADRTTCSLLAATVRHSLGREHHSVSTFALPHTTAWHRTRSSAGIRGSQLGFHRAQGLARRRVADKHSDNTVCQQASRPAGISCVEHAAIRWTPASCVLRPPRAGKGRADTDHRGQQYPCEHGSPADHG